MRGRPLAAGEALRPRLDRAELEAFADAVAGKVRFVIAPEEIVNVVAGTEAVAASARSGKAVAVG